MLDDLTSTTVLVVDVFMVSGHEQPVAHRADGRRLNSIRSHLSPRDVSAE